MKLMSTLLPPNIDFYRTPINSTLSNTHRRSPSLPITSELSTAAKEVLPPETRQKSSIYGSVTTADIAENLKAILAEDDEGVRVALTPEDITFVETGKRKTVSSIWEYLKSISGSRGHQTLFGGPLRLMLRSHYRGNKQHLKQ